MFKSEKDIQTFIESAESLYHQADSGTEGYTACREYYENYQKPTGIPDDVSYIVKNVITDYVDRKVSKLVAGRIEPILKGVGDLREPLRILLEDILEENEFQDLLLEYRKWFITNTSLLNMA